MPKRISITLLLCIFVLSIFSCHRKNDSDYIGTHPEFLELESDITNKALQTADSLLASLTLEERVGQCLFPSIFTGSDSATIQLFKRYIEDYHVGGIVLLQGDINSARRIAEIGKKADVPLIIAIDAEWGLGMRLNDAPVYPKNGDINYETEETELFDYGREVGIQCREIGVNMVLGPVVDITSHRGGVIGKRSFGKDPEKVSNFGVAYAKGLESAGVLSVAKHFPGHGSTVIDSHKGVAKIKKGISDLDSIDLKPFRNYVKAGLSGIMAGHIQAFSLDPGGAAASVSVDMLTFLLRDELGFKGLVLTDAFDMGGAKDFSATEALKAGADIILCPADINKEYRELVKNVKSGVIPLSILNDRVRRILFYKVLFLDI